MMRRSPDLASASTCRSKIWSKPKSLPPAVGGHVDRRQVEPDTASRRRTGEQIAQKRVSGVDAYPDRFTGGSVAVARQRFVEARGETRWNVGATLIEPARERHTARALRTNSG